MQSLTDLTNILDERLNDYGSFYVHAKDVAKAWSDLTGHEFTPKLVAMMMIQFKMLREPTYDTLIDIAGYALHAAELDAINENLKGLLTNATQPTGM